MYPIVKTTYGTLTLTPFDPQHYPGPLLAGALALIANEDYGTVLLQEYTSPQFTLRHHTFQFSRKMRVQLTQENQSLQLSAALKNPLRMSIQSRKALMVREGQFTLVPQPVDTLSFTFEKRKEYRHFSIHYTAHLLEQLCPLFPHLPLLKTFETATFSPLPRSTLWMPTQMKDIIQQVLHCSYEPHVRAFYFDNKIRELLLLALIETTSQQPDTRHLTPADIEAVHAARAFILSDLQQHFSITQLARQVHINEFKLKIGFKKLFGTGPFGCLKQARMQQAHDLLLHTDKPIKEIASLAGYESLTSFIGAFRKYFGYTPGHVRYR